MHKFDADIVFAGGGLASCLTALRISTEKPECSIIMVEAGPEICGNHTWSFHQTDLAKFDYERVRPLIAHSWPGQKVIFPQFERELPTPYASMTSQSLRRAVNRTANIDVRENCEVSVLTADSIRLASGEEISSPCIIDGRGFVSNAALDLGFQKFVGLELSLASPHGETVPTIMDASVSQRDGYRFVYILPLAPDRLLIEDTRYSDGSALDEEAVARDALEYAAARGWEVRDTIRVEKGVLPVCLAHDVEQFWRNIDKDAAPVGLRAGLFHPTTGYSLPSAVAVANVIAGLDWPLTTHAVRKAVCTHAVGQNRRHGFFRMLNRMLFRAAAPEKRYIVLQRFYGLPRELIERFYAGRLRFADKMRILVGKPPVPIYKALGCVSESRRATQRKF